MRARARGKVVSTGMRHLVAWLEVCALSGYGVPTTLVERDCITVSRLSSRNCVTHPRVKSARLPFEGVGPNRTVLSRRGVIPNNSRKSHLYSAEFHTPGARSTLGSLPSSSWDVRITPKPNERLLLPPPYHPPYDFAMMIIIIFFFIIMWFSV